MLNVQVLTRPGHFETGQIPTPTPQPGEVLVKAAAVSICGSDLAAFRGTHPTIRPPTIIGHEFSGVVAELGPGVADLEVGDRVCVDPTFGCGKCKHCMNGRPNICSQYRVMGRTLTFPGAMAGLVRVPSDHVYRLPRELDFEVAALVQPLAVSYHAAIHRGGISPNDTVLIAGAGAIGMGILMAAKEVGAKVLVTDLVPSRLDLAVELGADRVLNPLADNLANAVSVETEGYGVDLAFEAVGGTSDAVFFELVNLTSRGGTVVVVGLKTDEARVPIKHVKYTEKTITGSSANPGSFPAVIERIRSGRYAANRLISHRLPFVDVAQAFELLDHPHAEVMKVILRPDHA